MAPISLLLSLQATPGAFSYVPIGSPQALSNYNQPRHLGKPTAQTKKRTLYDLGLGKNEPVGVSKSDHNKLHNVGNPTEFWMVQDSARSFPVPGVEQPMEKPKIQLRRRSVSIVPTRLSEDVVSISKEDDGSFKVSQSGQVKLELNTLWVEMFIHNQLLEMQKL